MNMVSYDRHLVCECDDPTCWKEFTYRKEWVANPVYLARGLSAVYDVPLVVLFCEQDFSSIDVLFESDAFRIGIELYPPFDEELYLQDAEIVDDCFGFSRAVFDLDNTNPESENYGRAYHA